MRMFKTQAESRIEAIDDRLDELHQQFDYQAACDPTVDSSQRDLELFRKVEQLELERSRLRRFLRTH